MAIRFELMYGLDSKRHQLARRLCGWLRVALIYALPLIPVSGSAAIFLKVEDIKGDVTEQDHRDWIDTYSVQYGVNRPVSAPGPTGFSQLTVTKALDLSTVPLFREATVGEDKTVELELVRTGRLGSERYYRLKLHNALVAAFSQSSAGERPFESVSFDYSKLDMTYTEYSPTGAQGNETSAWYDVGEQKGGYLPPGSPNTAPTISSIASTNTLEDTALTIAFTVGDAQTTPENLSLSASSSSATLLPPANVSFGGSGANRTVRLLPGTNQSGGVNVTITVSDGLLSADRMFTLNVTPVNDAPQIGTISSQSTSQETPITVGFTVNDPDNLADTLQLFAASSDTTLVPNANLSFGGTGSARTLTITPAAGRMGQTTISIRASDGLLETTNSFLLTVSVLHTNEAPSFIVSDSSVIRTIAGRPTSISRLQLSDPDAGMNAVSLAFQVVNGTLTASNAPGITITSNGMANVFLSGAIPALNALLVASNGIVYQPNAGIAGTDLLTVTVNDNGHTGSGGPLAVFTTLGIRIYRSQYDQWLHQEFTQAELDNPSLEGTLWGIHADSENDRLENLAEYGLGTAPRGTNHPRPAAEYTVQSGSNYLTLQFNRRKDPDLTLAVEVANDVLGPWLSNAVDLQTIPAIDLGNGFEQVRFIDRIATSTAQKRFMRMRWTLTQPLAAAPPGKSTRR